MPQTLLALGALLPVVSCSAGDGTDCDAPGVREVVVQFGIGMQQVSLQSPARVGASAIHDAYATLVTAELLESWTAEPRQAPGIQVPGEPWPAGIEVTSADHSDAGGCEVKGEVLYVTRSSAGSTPSANRRAVTLRVVSNGGWRVASFEEDAP